MNLRRLRKALFASAIIALVAIGLFLWLEGQSRSEAERSERNQPVRTAGPGDLASATPPTPRAASADPKGQGDAPVRNGAALLPAVPNGIVPGRPAASTAGEHTRSTPATQRRARAPLAPPRTVQAVEEELPAEAARAQTAGGAAAASLAEAYAHQITPQQKVQFLQRIDTEAAAANASGLLRSIVEADGSPEARQEALTASSFLDPGPALQQIVDSAARPGQAIDLRLQALNLQSSIAPAGLDRFLRDQNPDVRAAAELLVRMRDTQTALPERTLGVKVSPSNAQ